MRITRAASEQFTNETDFNTHYTIVDNDSYAELTEEDCERLAYELSRKSVDHKSICGYTSEDDEGCKIFIKYEKNTGYFVTYAYKEQEPYTISFSIKTWREFCGDRTIEYIDEIPIGL